MGKGKNKGKNKNKGKGGDSDEDENWLTVSGWKRPKLSKERVFLLSRVTPPVVCTRDLPCGMAGAGGLVCA